VDRKSGAFRANEVEVKLSEQKMWYLISYDVRDEKRLLLTAKLLKGYGSRIQFSVFRCRLSKRQVERLKWDLTKIMAKEDDLLIIGICHKCSSRIQRRNVDETWTDEVKTYEIV
jgi:CRISPR-associated protein Cas2